MGIKGWNFPVQVDEKTGKIKLAEDNENVRQGIRIILGTQRGERKMRLSFGTDTNKFVFEPIREGFVDELAREVGVSINTWEKNLEHIDVKATSSPTNNSLVKVDISYMTSFEPEVETFSRVLNQNEGM